MAVNTAIVACIISISKDPRWILNLCDSVTHNTVSITECMLPIITIIHPICSAHEYPMCTVRRIRLFLTNPIINRVVREIIHVIPLSRKVHL